MTDSEFDEADDPSRNPSPVFVEREARRWIRAGKKSKWQHHADTRRSLAVTIVSATIGLYACLVLAVICKFLGVDDAVKVVAALSPLQSLAAATVGFFFARGSGR